MTRNRSTTTEMAAGPTHDVEDRAGGPDDWTALIDRWRTGDSGAFRDVVHRFHAPLLSYVISMLRNLHEAEDAVQDTWLKAHRSAHQIRDASSVWGWLKRIAHNSALDAARESRRRGIPTDPALLSEIGGDPAEGGDGTNDEIPLEAIVDAIESLPETYREAAVYHYLQEWPYAKIAVVLGIAPAAARQRISRAGKMLRLALHQTGKANCHDV